MKTELRKLYEPASKEIKIKEKIDSMMEYYEGMQRRTRGKSPLFPFVFLSLLSLLFVYLKKPTGLTLGTDTPRPA